MPISDRRTAATGAAVLALLSACAQQPDNATLAEVEAEQARAAAAAGRIPCALAGAENFRTDCTLDRITSADGTILVLGRADAGYRRFRVAPGYGVVAADGAEQARVSVVDNGVIEVSIANDRYRLPATIQGGSGQSGSDRMPATAPARP
jgi:hypothetical protein